VGYAGAMKLAALLFLAIVLSACRTSPKPGAIGSTSTTSSSNISGEGLASWYGKQFAGKQTANGEIFDPNGMTAAHRTLKFGTCVKVELVSNGKTVEVRVNDRGPFVKDRIIDLSEEAAKQLGLIDEGVGRVRLSGCG
jgi:rare lipoprotein A